MHSQRTNQLLTRADSQVRFLLYQREILVDSADYSRGIIFRPRGDPPLTLARYNGPSHVHGETYYQPHMHTSTENAILTGKKAESMAEETNRDFSIKDALACSIADYHMLARLCLRPTRHVLAPSKASIVISIASGEANRFRSEMRTKPKLGSTVKLLGILGFQCSLPSTTWRSRHCDP